MSSRTTFLSRLIGLYCLLISLAMFAHKQTMVAAVTALAHDPLQLYMVGVIVTPIGLAMVLGHNVWSGGARPVLVTLIGWGTLIKGLIYLFIPQTAAPAFFLGGLQYASLFYLYATVTLLLGLYLSIGAGREHGAS
ncbi:hypothetical protein QU481_10315 [Crenobacter sp. SG2303]|uniref:Uncharacterized protein n=1 Tax=Crenobacter oryzisoli TaxID=3056844 RepID=A0ABT7XNA9_9NEIS|nr:hypothetical protein [Crenobacter sp. SG2303]MDN0075283.1 hypothetical protein [Crenobacter sp. SG2303]